MNTKTTACLVTILTLTLLQGCARVQPKKLPKQLNIQKVILVDSAPSAVSTEIA